MKGGHKYISLALAVIFVVVLVQRTSFGPALAMAAGLLALIGLVAGVLYVRHRRQQAKRFDDV